MVRSTISALLYGSIAYFVAFMTSVPIINDGTGHSYDKHRIIEIVILSLALLTGVFSPKPARLSNTAEKAILLVILLGLLSAFLAPVPTYAFIELSMFIGLWCIVIHFREFNIHFGHTNPTLLFSSLLFVAAVVYLPSFPVGIAAGIDEGGAIHWWDLFRGYENIRFFNQFQIWTLPLLTLLFIARPFDRHLPRKAVAFALAFWWMLLYATVGRGAILATFLSTLMLGIIYRSHAIAFIRTQLLFAISGFLLFIFMDAGIQLITSSSANMPAITRSGVPGREALWTQAVHLIIENPVLGVGPMHYAWHPNPVAAHPHNSVLQWAAEWGIPSFGLVLFLFAYGTYHWLRHFSSETIQQLSTTDKNVILGLTCSALAGFGYSLVSGVIVMPMGQIMLAIVLGLMMGAYKQSAPSLPSVPFSAQKKGKLWKILYASILTLLLTTIWPSLTQHLQGESFGFSGHIHTRGPRLWRIGGIPHDEKNSVSPREITNNPITQ